MTKHKWANFKMNQNPKIHWIDRVSDHALVIGLVISLILKIIVG
jgi:hypothetical protein